jgi:hypothetical protein
MSVTINGTTGITTPDIDSTQSTLGPLTQALNLGSTGQIVFPATQNASSNANTLDDYEEGTFTPGIASGAGSITSYTATGVYTKIGRVVTAVIIYEITDNGTGSSAGVFTGLPFTIQTIGVHGIDRIGGTTGNTAVGISSIGQTSVSLFNYNNLYPWATNANGAFTITYQTNT